MILDPFLWPGACSDPHVISPVFFVDSNPWHFQDLNRSSSGSNRGYVMKMAKNVPLIMLFKIFFRMQTQKQNGGFWSGHLLQAFPPFFFIFWCILLFAKLDPPPLMR
jgi:hypothetical protein